MTDNVEQILASCKSGNPVESALAKPMFAEATTDEKLAVLFELTLYGLRRSGMLK